MATMITFLSPTKTHFTQGDQRDFWTTNVVYSAFVFKEYLSAHFQCSSNHYSLNIGLFSDVSLCSIKRKQKPVEIFFKNKSWMNYVGGSKISLIRLCEVCLRRTEKSYHYGYRTQSGRYSTILVWKRRLLLTDSIYSQGEKCSASNETISNDSYMGKIIC